MMAKLMEKKPVLHAVVWILLYLALVNIAQALSKTPDSLPLVTGALLLGLSAALIVYLKQTRRLSVLGTGKVTAVDSRKALFYLPLLLIALVQLIQGIDPSMTVSKTLALCLMMAGTGLIEELLFRGLLFRAIRGKSGARRAILISGITFGIGHIVNLLNGYALAELAGQIAAAIVTGIVLALLVEITGNLVPGILFHILFNISGTLTRQDSTTQAYILVFIAAVAVPYAVYLRRSVVPAQMNAARSSNANAARFALMKFGRSRGMIPAPKREAPH